MIPGFNELKEMFKNGKLSKELREQYSKELREREKHDKLKYFKASDGTIIDLHALKHNITPLDDLLIVQLPTFPPQEAKIPIEILSIE